ncbi:MAG: hypothetical protein ACPGYT_04210 [Nitrospirales bacterium]
MKIQYSSLWATCAYLLILLQGCTQSTNAVFWSKAGSAKEELQRDKKECQDLQRSVGADEWRIHKCLEVKGWTQVENKP